MTLPPAISLAVRETLTAMIEQGPCAAARESLAGYLTDSVNRAGSHPLAPEHACPFCDAARYLGVPDRWDRS